MAVDEVTDPPESSKAQGERREGEADDDSALILWMLGLDPTRRLAVAQGFVDSAEELRHGRRDPRRPARAPGVV